MKKLCIQATVKKTGELFDVLCLELEGEFVALRKPGTTDEKMGKYKLDDVRLHITYESDQGELSEITVE